MVLIDTSSWTHALRRKGNPEIRKRVERLVVNAQVAWCDVVRLELWHGVRDDEDRASMRELEAEIRILEITSDVWNTACDLGSFGRGKGLIVPTTDLVIFACARIHGVSIEHNDRHYDHLDALLAQSRIPDRLADG